MSIIDLSYIIDNNTPTCGTSWHQNVQLKPMGTIDEVGRNTHSILLGSHTATHMDAALHFVPGGRTIDKLPLEVLCGPVTIVDFSRKGMGDVVTKHDLEHITITERMIFRFGWDRYWKTPMYYNAYPYFEKNAALYLLEKGMKLIGLDTPSPDDSKAITMTSDDSKIHKIFLKNNVIIIEYLCNVMKADLDKEYDIIALPLKLRGMDGAPARVIIVEKNGGV